MFLDKFLRRTLVACITVLAALLVSLFVRSVLLVPFVVEGSSMEKGIQAGDHLLASPLPYAFGHPSRGDVVVVDTAGIAALGSRHYIVKRVVAVPGDTVGVNNCRLVLNGSIIVEEYVAAESLVGCDSVEDEVTLGSNQYYVLGDNRAASTDSRIFGPVPDWSLVGKVIFEL